MRNVAQNLKTLRVKKNLEQKDVAKETGLSLSTIINIESGITSDISINTIVKLAEFFDVKVHEFVYKEFE